MKKIIDSIFVSSSEQKKRLKACEGCNYFSNTRTCGRPIVGDTIQMPVKGGGTATVRLCGCFMDAKTRLKMSYCPIGEWNRAEIAREDVEFVNEIKDFLKKEIDGKSVIQNHVVRRLYAFHNKTHGSKNTNTGCDECVRQALDDLRSWIDSLEAKN